MSDKASTNFPFHVQIVSVPKMRDGAVVLLPADIPLPLGHYNVSTGEVTIDPEKAGAIVVVTLGNGSEDE